MKRYEYLRKIYDNESSLDFDLSKLGLAGWLVCAVVRHNPSPARIQYMVWYARELGKSYKPSLPENFKPSSAPVIGDGVPRVEGDPLANPVNWPEITPDYNPFDSDDYNLPDLDDDDED